MENNTVTSEIKISGILPELAVEEFDANASLDEVLPQEVATLFQSVLPEFSDQGFTYNIVDEKNVLNFDLENINANITVINNSPWVAWDYTSKTDSFIIRTVLPETISYSDSEVMGFNKIHPSLKFYTDQGHVVIEESYYLGYGIPVLNIMDRLQVYLKTIISF